MPKQPIAIALFSGGLDSILACRVVAAQGVKVKAIKFVTPFFDYDLLSTEEQYRKKIRDKYDIDVEVKDITDPYLRMLYDPPHGFGKHFNPCIDCKILMIREAKKLMTACHGSFLLTGEVIGQRPMSQRKDTLRIIERDSGTDSLLLRPLCAGSLKPTAAELSGLIDREKLPHFNGRGRSGQIKLAGEFGITDFPSPAGGCVLTDRNLAKRIRMHYNETTEINREDIRFLLVGRQFRLPHGGWLAIGRDEKENDAVMGIRQPGDLILRADDRPGPTALLRHCRNQEDVSLSAALVARYCKKNSGAPLQTMVTVTDDRAESLLSAAPVSEEQLAGLQIL
ncbi:MAG: thiamine biosynthesis protein [Deltaproteobacteria bacterium]|nr:thiamine biosynthesis protein [Deltaproteobacteria bacterium]